VKLLRVVLLFVALGLVAAARQPKAADFPTEFIVLSAEMSGNQVVDMTLEGCLLPRGQICEAGVRSGRALYYVTSVSGPWYMHGAYMFQPGTHIFGRFRVGQQIEIILTDDRGRLRTGWYGIRRTVLE